MIITLRKSPTTVEFKQPMNDEKVKSLNVAKWKPIHLMIYFDRQSMIESMIDFAHGAVRKAISLDNKKQLAVDDFLALKMCVRLKRTAIFQSLWNLCNIWSINHLFLLLKDLKIPTNYSEPILKEILMNHTTKDILVF